MTNQLLVLRLAPAQPLLHEPAMTASNTQLVQIEKPVYGGAFLARVEGKAVLCRSLCRAREARVRMVEEKRGYALAEAEEIVAPSRARITPGCAHFGACGGSPLPAPRPRYATSIQKGSFARNPRARRCVALPEITVSAAGPGTIATGFDLHLMARENLAIADAVRMPSLPSASAPLPRLYCSTLLSPLPQCPRIRSHTSSHGDEPFLQWGRERAARRHFHRIAGRFRIEEVARVFNERVPELQGLELVVEGRKGEQPRTLARWGASSLTYRAAAFDYRVGHGSFFQVNRWLVDSLIERVTADRSGKLAWDLFAGVGLFARQLSASFAHVVAVESAPFSIEALKRTSRTHRAKS